MLINFVAVHWLRPQKAKQRMFDCERIRRIASHAGTPNTQTLNNNQSIARRCHCQSAYCQIESCIQSEVLSTIAIAFQLRGEIAADMARDSRRLCWVEAQFNCALDNSIGASSLV